MFAITGMCDIPMGGTVTGDEVVCIVGASTCYDFYIICLLSDKVQGVIYSK